MKKENQLIKAFELAYLAHKGQVDKSGVDYILHPLAVAKMTKTPKGKIVALLHDVVEDSNVTIKDLKKCFNDEIVYAVNCLTKRKQETFENYYQRIIRCDLAIEVKFCDMIHNTDESRFFYGRLRPCL